MCTGDLPNIIRLERIANAFRLKELQTVFSESVLEWGDRANFGYNP